MAILRLSKKQELRLEVQEWKGRPYLSFRAWKVTPVGAFPEKGKGFSLAADRAGELIEAVRATVEEA